MKAVKIGSCPKTYTRDLDKAAAPEETIAMVRDRLARSSLDIVAETRRIDTGRLGIPVYLSICGADAREIMPTRKQMGKGSSPAQARASALMELMERYAFFSFWQRELEKPRLGWKEAEKRFGADLIPVEEILRSVNDSMDADKAREILDLAKWLFYPATRLRDGKIVWLPLDWFRMLGEFNGSSAGNTVEESLLQGVAELIERHVSCIVAQEKPELATIDTTSSEDQALRGLLAAFNMQNIKLVLKDISLGMPMPTVAALAWDPATFPQRSEIVFTAGSATSPDKAAVRAITEVAQLAGDFSANARYEASGLPKFSSLWQCAWLLDGPTVPLESLPSVASDDLGIELAKTLQGLLPIEVYGVETTSPDLNIPAHYCIAPGFKFRERDKNQSLGLFVGRKLAEESGEAGGSGLDRLEKLCPNAHYLPFFRGLAALNQGDSETSVQYFRASIPLQPDNESKAMASFYAAYALTQMEDWKNAVPLLESAGNLCGEVKEYPNLLGVAYFKMADYAAAEACFDRALNLDKGSAMDLANRGVCRKLQGKTEEAREDLLDALRLDASLDFARKHLSDLENE